MRGEIIFPWLYIDQMSNLLKIGCKDLSLKISQIVMSLLTPYGGALTHLFVLFRVNFLIFLCVEMMLFILPKEKHVVSGAPNLYS